MASTDSASYTINDTESALLRIYSQVDGHADALSILGLYHHENPVATDVSAAFRELVLYLHPDKCTNPKQIELHTRLFRKVEQARKQLIVFGYAKTQQHSVLQIEEDEVKALRRRVLDAREKLKAETAGAIANDFGCKRPTGRSRQCDIDTLEEDGNSRYSEYSWKRKTVTRGKVSSVSLQEKVHREVHHEAAQEFREMCLESSDEEAEFWVEARWLIEEEHLELQKGVYDRNGEPTLMRNGAFAKWYVAKEKKSDTKLRKHNRPSQMRHIKVVKRDELHGAQWKISLRLVSSKQATGLHLL